MQDHPLVPRDQVRPYVLPQGSAPISVYTTNPHAPELPVDVQPGAEFQWRQGYAERAQHHYDSELGQCRGCGSTDFPHCEGYLAGYRRMRDALTDPGTMPGVTP